MVVFIELFNNRCRVLGLENRKQCSGKEVKDWITENEGLPTADCVLLNNGRILDNDAMLSLDKGDHFLRCCAPLVGGKGGFGSMLRAIGAQIEKTTNREACRDLSGRRMRDVNDEKKIADWLAKQSEREEEKAMQKQQRLEKLKSTPRHMFEDSTAYTSQLQENVDSVQDSLQKGLKSSTGYLSSGSSTSGKRKANEKIKKTHRKKRKLWLGIDEDLSSDSDDEGDTISLCSSITDSENLASEPSSEMSDPALGHTSEAEPSDGQGNQSLSEVEKQQPQGMQEIKACAMSVSTSSVPCDAGGERHESSLKSIKENQNNDLGKDTMPSINSNEKVTGTEAKPNEEESKPHSSISLPLDLNQYQSQEEVEALGLDVLKSALIALGLKCGGTLQQRAERLFSTKGIAPEKLDPSLLAKPSRKGHKKGK